MSTKLTNRTFLCGNTGREVEIFTFQDSGNLKASVSLATTSSYINAENIKVSESTWHNLVSFGKVAEIFKNHVPKGKHIAVEGKLTYRSYEDKDGIKRTITEIIVDEILLL